MARSGVWRRLARQVVLLAVSLVVVSSPASAATSTSPAAQPALVREARLDPTGDALGDEGDSFGTSVAADGDTVAVGVPGHDVPIVDAGCVYVYERNAGAWTIDGEAGWLRTPARLRVRLAGDARRGHPRRGRGGATDLESGLRLRATGGRLVAAGQAHAAGPGRRLRGVSRALRRHPRGRRPRRRHRLRKRERRGLRLHARGGDVGARAGDPRLRDRGQRPFRYLRRARRRPARGRRAVRLSRHGGGRGLRLRVRARGRELEPGREARRSRGRAMVPVRQGRGARGRHARRGRTGARRRPRPRVRGDRGGLDPPRPPRLDHRRSGAVRGSSRPPGWADARRLRARRRERRRGRGLRRLRCVVDARHAPRARGARTVRLLRDRGRPHRGDRDRGRTAAARDRAAWVWTRPGSSWSIQARLDNPGTTKDDAFGSALALEDTTLVVGAPDDDTVSGRDSGAVYVFERLGPAWVLRQKLLPPPGLPGASSWEGPRFGTSVALSGDRLAVGAPHAHDTQGRVLVFTRTAGTWSLSAELAQTDPSFLCRVRDRGRAAWHAVAGRRPAGRLRDEVRGGVRVRGDGGHLGTSAEGGLGRHLERPRRGPRHGPVGRDRRGRGPRFRLGQRPRARGRRLGGGATAGARDARLSGRLRQGRGPHRNRRFRGRAHLVEAFLLRGGSCPRLPHLRRRVDRRGPAGARDGATTASISAPRSPSTGRGSPSARRETTAPGDVHLFECGGRGVDARCPSWRETGVSQELGFGSSVAVHGWPSRRRASRAPTRRPGSSSGVVHVFGPIDLRPGRSRSTDPPRRRRAPS